jgi:hypothetical protein
LFDLFYDQLLIIILITKDIKYIIKRPVTVRKRMELAAGFGIGGYCSLWAREKEQGYRVGPAF